MYKSRSSRNGNLFDLVMPFLIVICVGIIGVLLYNLYQVLIDDGESKVAYMHVIDGTVDMKTWGTDDFFSLSEDSLVMEGDQLVTSSGAKIIIEFFDGTIVRLAGGSDVIFSNVNDDPKEAVIEISLNDGMVWVNKVYRDTASTLVSVKTDHVEVVSNSSSIFEVENDIDEIVRVISGKYDDIKVNIYNRDGVEIVETQPLGVGQEATFSGEVLEKYWQYQSPEVLSAVTTEFRESAWYIWNSDEDKDPTVFEISSGGDSFIRVEPEEVVVEEGEYLEGEVVEGELIEEAVSEGKLDDEEVVVEEEDLVEEELEEEPVVVVPLSTPTIVSVGGMASPDADGFYTATGNPVVLTGVALGAHKVVVNNYTLQKFTDGAEKWEYFANPDFALIKEGENIYEVYSIDSAGVKSEILTFKVKYTRGVEEEEVVDEETEEEVEYVETEDHL